MRRRTFIASLGCAAAAWPLETRAQQRVPRIGFLGALPIDESNPLVESFRAGMRDLGYAEAKSIDFVFRFPERAGETLPQISKFANELVDLKVDVIVSPGVGVYAASKLTRTIPIVSLASGNLVALGLAESLGHPGGNVTGLIFFGEQLAVKRAEMLRRIKPSIAKIGLVLVRGALSGPGYARALDGLAKTANIGLEVIELLDPKECEPALDSGPGATVDGLVVVEYPQFENRRATPTIAAAAILHNLPSAGSPFFARSGGLLGYGVDFFQMARHAAVFVDKILKGAKPGDIPIEQATKFETVVNLKTAKALNFEIAPTLLTAADEVIE